MASVVLTAGDDPVTAQVIARQAGAGGDAVIIGTDLEAMGDEALTTAVDRRGSTGDDAGACLRMILMHEQRPAR